MRGPLVRSHYLVAVTEKRLAIGRFGFREGVKGETLVDVGNAKSEADAVSKAVARFARKMRINPILVGVSQVRKVETAQTQVDQAFSAMDLDKLAANIGKGNVVQCGSIAIKVRGA